MATDPLVAETPLQRLLAERGIALAKELEAASRQAPPGLTLARCETVALERGRLLLRDALASALQQQVAEGEKRGHPPAPAHAATPGATRGGRPRPS
jgi:hypothetical protein